MQINSMIQIPIESQKLKQIILPDQLEVVQVTNNQKMVLTFYIINIISKRKIKK